MLFVDDILEAIEAIFILEEDIIIVSSIPSTNMYVNYVVKLDI